ncbi:MAG TPA: glycosyltransferase [Acidimicrobiales bacterium]|nr:glycosyltransferase [Acidimicrobiales bacterium]
MSRILITVPPLTGHVNPTVSLGAELSARGHAVAWAGLPGVVDELLPAGSVFLPVVGDLDQSAFDDMQRRGAGLRGARALKFLWEDFLIPYARTSVGALSTIVDAFRPDVLVVDQQDVAGAVVARLAGLPWVTSATTSAELADPLAALPRVDQWVREQLSALQLEHGLDRSVAARGDLRFSESLIIAFTTRALVGTFSGRAAAAGPAIRFVGPSMIGRVDRTPFPWEWLDGPGPAVLVSLGTVNASIGSRFFATVVAALRGSPIRAVVVAPPELVPSAGATDNVLVRPRVPQLDVLDHMDAVVSHGGHNTVCESLARGLPLVLAPIRDDQPIVTEQVVRAGAGLRVKFGRVIADEMADALHRVLTEPSFRDAAQSIRASFVQAGGAGAAADAVEELLTVGAAR